MKGGQAAEAVQEAQPVAVVKMAEWKGEVARAAEGKAAVRGEAVVTVVALAAAKALVVVTSEGARMVAVGVNAGKIT